jgi:hypothetical protein
MESPLDSLRLSPRKHLRPGLTFRLKRVGHNTPLGQFVCRRLWRDSRRPRRVYCDALSLRTGCTHTLYLDGPTYTSPVDGSLVRPYRVALVRAADPVREARARRRKRTPQASAATA